MPTQDTQSRTIVHIPKSGNYQKQVPKKPVIFCAGPIRNGPPWHDEAIRHFADAGIDAFIASPARSIAPDLEKFLALPDDMLETFPRQRAWEHYYLDKAAHEGGVVMFWLPAEIKPKPDAEKQYGHITQMELSWALIQASCNPHVKLVIGADLDYPEWSTVLYEIRHYLPNVVIHASLQECCFAAIDAVNELHQEGRLFLKRNATVPNGKAEFVDIEEFARRMTERKPTKLFNTQYSRKKPFYEITKYLDGGAVCFCTGQADQTPQFKTWKQLYEAFRQGGFLDCRVE